MTRVVVGETPGWHCYEVYDALACAMRRDIYSVDDEANVYVETQRILGFGFPPFRTVKSNRIIIPPTPGMIVINALDDEDDNRQTEGANRGQKAVA